MPAPTIPRYVSLPKVMSFARNPIDGLMSYIERYGKTFYIYVGGMEKSLITVDPEIVQHVLQRNHRAYEKSALQTEIISKYVGKGLLTNTGASWLRQRRLIQPGFHRSRLVALTEIMQKVISQELDELLVKTENGQQEVDVYDEMLNIAFRIVARAIFSEDMEEAELVDFGEKVTAVQEYVVKEVRLPFLRWYFKLSGIQGKNLAISNEILELQRQFIHRRKALGASRDDLLQMLLDARYEDTGLPMEEQQLMEETGILFVAGHETSANALSWIFYLLAKHPEVKDKVCEELNRVSPSSPPDFEALKELRFMTQVINESMRLYPPAWITDRVALEDDEVAGIKIPKGTIVVPFIYGIHHQEALWKEALQFRPERFEATEKKEQQAFSFLPFGGGPRLCIGNSFAMMEMQLVLANWLKRFTFELIPNQIIKPKPLVTLRPENGIRMYLHENKDFTYT